MGFTITESKNGYTYKDKNYKWGEGLIEFINFDFSDFIKLIDKIELDNYNKMLGTNFTKKMINIATFYKPMLKHESKSLHINLLKDYLLEFFDIYDSIDYVDNSNENIKIRTKKHSIDDLMYDLQWIFKVPLKIKQHEYKSVLKDYLLNQKNISQDTISKLEHYISKEKEFPYMKKSIKKIKQNGSIEYETTFYVIEEFCKYEFFKLLENGIYIFQCPHCQKLFIPKKRRTKFCTSKCQKQYNAKKSKNNPYNSIYNKIYKDIDNYCSRSYSKDLHKKEREILLRPFEEIYNNCYKRPTRKGQKPIKYNLFVKKLEKQYNSSAVNKRLNKEFSHYLK